MAKKSSRILVRLVSEEDTGFFYTTSKQTKSAAGKTIVKLRLKKYDPKVRKHVWFKEEKIDKKKK